MAPWWGSAEARPVERTASATMPTHDQIAQIFVSALAQIARIQHVTIVAEGVETEEEFTLARAAGCNRFQGYFFGRPAPRDKAGALLAARTGSLARTA